MSSNRYNECEGIVFQHTAAAIGGAVIPLPVADLIAIEAAQFTMCVRIAKEYNRGLEKNMFKALIGMFLTAKVGSWLASWTKSIPGLGSIVGGIAQAMIAGGVTTAFGYAFLELCEKGEKFDEKSMQRAKEATKGKAEQAKARMEKDKEKIKRVNFKVPQIEVSTNFKASFNLSELESPYLRINSIYGEYDESFSLTRDKTSISIDLSNLPKGEYIATINAKNFIGVGINFKKV